MVETGLPGRPKKYFDCGADALSRAGVSAPHEPRDAAEYYWFSGLDSGSGEEEFGVEVDENLFDEVVASHGDAAGRDQQIALETFFDQIAQAVRVVGRDGQDHGLAASLLDLDRERIAVGIANLCGIGGGFDCDDFVTRGQNGDTRTNEYLQARFADRGGEGDGGFVEARAGSEQKAAAFGLGSLSDDVFGGRDASCDCD
jgi:hypothetical protein